MMPSSRVRQYVILELDIPPNDRPNWRMTQQYRNVVAPAQNQRVTVLTSPVRLSDAMQSFTSFARIADK